MAKFEVSGIFVEVGVGVLVSEGSLGIEVEDELDISTSISETSGSLICSINDRDSIWSGTDCSGTDCSRTETFGQVVEVVCKFGVCCWGLSEATSLEATSEAFSRLDSTPGNSPG